jgi:hypothetical protein
MITHEVTDLIGGLEVGAKVSCFFILQHWPGCYHRRVRQARDGHGSEPEVNSSDIETHASLCSLLKRLTSYSHRGNTPLDTITESPQITEIL